MKPTIFFLLFFVSYPVFADRTPIKYIIKTNNNGEIISISSPSTPKCVNQFYKNIGLKLGDKYYQPYIFRFTSEQLKKMSPMRIAELKRDRELMINEEISFFYLGYPSLCK